jgi:type VII secretion integral membrane protein EccD
LPALADARPILHPLAPGLLVAGAAVSAYTALALALVGLPVPFVTAVGLGSLLGAAGAGAAAFGSLTTAATAAVVALAGTVLLPAVPMAAFRLAGLRLEPLPTRPEHLQENIDPEPGAQVLAEAAEIDQYMIALYAGLAAPVTVAAVLLGRVTGWQARLTVIMLALVWVLSARATNSAWHRLALWVPAAAGLFSLILSLARSDGPGGRTGVVVLLQVIVVLLFVAGRVIPNRRLTPYWGRAGDILQIIATVVLVPAVLAVLGAFGWARGLVS